MMPKKQAPMRCCGKSTCNSSNTPPYLQKRICGHCGAKCDECLIENKLEVL